MKSRTLARARYSPELLARVSAGWQRLSDDERQGVSRAARVAAELGALGAPPALLTVAAHVVADEVRHVGVCQSVLQALDGARPADPLELALGLPLARAASEAPVARALIADFALGKPARAAAFAGARAVVREPLLAWAYTELLRDEARHATFGAKAGSWVIRHWSTRQRQSLWVECLTAADGTAPRPSDHEAESLGLLPGEIDYGLPRWLLPHLRPLGMLPTPANDPAFLH